MYIACFISVVNRTYQVPLCIQHILLQYSMGHTRYYFIYNMFYFSSQQDILGTIMYITCFISVVNRTYQVLLCIYHVLFQQSTGHTRYYYVYNMFYFNSQQDILGTIMYIPCFISVVNRDILGTIMYITCFIISSQQDILGTIMYITCFISVVNMTYQVLLCI